MPTRRRAPAAPRTTVHLYAVGTGNPGPGAWSVRIEHRGQVHRLDGADLSTTSLGMQLAAHLAAFERIRALGAGEAGIEPQPGVEVWSGTRVVATGLRKDLAEWEARGWRTRAGEPVPHETLWTRLKALADACDVVWHLPTAPRTSKPRPWRDPALRALARDTHGRLPAEPPAATRLYTDAAVHGASRLAVWAVVIENDRTTRKRCGLMKTRSPNRAELRAGVEALRAIPAGAEAMLVTDSLALLHKATAPAPGHDANLPRLERRLRTLDAERRVRWRWTPAHAGDPGNEAAHALATRTLKRVLARGARPTAGPTGPDDHPPVQGEGENDDTHRTNHE